MEDLIVVVRSAGERTEEACIGRVKSQTGGGSEIHAVRNVPFEEAHMRSVRLAAESGARWALFLDADVLLREKAVEAMLAEARACPSPFYMLNFRILDLGFAGPAFGVHFYDARLLEQALEFEGLARADQRPENRMVDEMRTKKGVSSGVSKALVGLHGYEQYYRDLYRTSFVRGVKFKVRHDYLLPTLRERCFLGQLEDLDYQVMLWGWLDGSVYALEHEKAPLDSTFYPEKAKNLMEMLHLAEKSADNPLGRDVEKTISEHRSDELYRANQRWLCPETIVPAPAGRRTWYQRGRAWLGRVKRRMVG